MTIVAPPLTISSYLEFLNVIRRRIEELNTTLESVGFIAGISPDYASKIVGRAPFKKMIVTTALTLAEALGSRVVLQLDPRRNREPEIYRAARQRLAPEKCLR